MLEQLKRARSDYPGQFWLLFWGMLLSTVGASMIWPFLMIYVSEKLALPLSTIASMLTVNALTGIFFSFLAGSLADRFGRKWVMVISLAYSGLHYVFLNQANSFGFFTLLMALSGAFNPLYRIGADAMIADLISPEKRAEAYSILRLSNNLGVALGPAIGGFIATSSYTLAFYLASTGMVVYAVLIAVFARETLPAEAHQSQSHSGRFAGFGQVLRDQRFMQVAGIFSLTMMSAVILWVLLSVYVKQNYGIVERQYGLIPMTNAVMVVLFQIGVTRITKRFPPLPVLALGSFFYAVGVASVALGAGFWGFWLSMVICTIGELVIVPTSNTYVANLAPADKRGRYMSIYGLANSLAFGIGPVVGGGLNDTFGPKATWYGGGLFGLFGVIGFLWVASKGRQRGEEFAPVTHEGHEV